MMLIKVTRKLFSLLKRNCHSQNLNVGPTGLQPLHPVVSYKAIVYSIWGLVIFHLPGRGGDFHCAVARYISFPKLE